MAVHATLTAITIDSANPKALAGFYQHVTGWPMSHSDDDSAYLGEGPIQLAFQRIDGYQGPQWPEAASHAHLDFTAADPAATVEELLALGATKPDFQPGEGQWTVLVDPEGHAFCIAAA
jgi:predicted enzyme related to lactoylglutathione lyase